MLYPLLITCFTLVSVSLNVVLSPVAHPFHFGVDLPSPWWYHLLLTHFTLVSISPHRGVIPCCSPILVSISPHCGVIPCCSPISFGCQSPLIVVLSPVAYPFHFGVSLPSPWCYPLLLTRFILVSISPHCGVIPCCSPISFGCQSPLTSPVASFFGVSLPSPWCYPLLLTRFILVSISPHCGVIPCCSPISFGCQSPLTVVLSPVAYPFHFGVSLPSPWCYLLLLTHFILVSVSPHRGVIPCCSPVSFWSVSPHRGVIAPVSHPLCFGIYILAPVILFFYFFFFFFPSTSLWGVYSETVIHHYNIHLTHAFTHLCIFFPHMYILHYGYSVHSFSF